jgi:hypothetical protein
VGQALQSRGRDFLKFFDSLTCDYLTTVIDYESEP